MVLSLHWPFLFCFVFVAVNGDDLPSVKGSHFYPSNSLEDRIYALVISQACVFYVNRDVTALSGETGTPLGNTSIHFSESISEHLGSMDDIQSEMLVLCDGLWTWVWITGICVQHRGPEPIPCSTSGLLVKPDVNMKSRSLSKRSWCSQLPWISQVPFTQMCPFNVDIYFSTDSPTGLTVSSPVICLCCGEIDSLTSLTLGKGEKRPLGPEKVKAALDRPILRLLETCEKLVLCLIYLSCQFLLPRDLTLSYLHMDTVQS